MSTPKTKSPSSNLQLVSDKEVAISLERLIDSVVGEVTARRSAFQPQQVIAELERVKEERAHDQMNFETEKCEWESKIDKYKEQCTELQSENEKLQSENEKLQSENEKLQNENKRLQKYVQDLESANINVEEKSQINLCHSDLTSQIAMGMNNTYLQTPIMNPPPGISRDYAYGSYLHAPNNPYPLSTSLYPASFNSRYPKSFSYPASCNSLYPSSASPYPVSSTKYYPASGSPYPASSTNRYPTSSNIPNPAPTSAYPSNSNRHCPATNSSYSGPTSMNQPPGTSPYPLMRSRCYDSNFGPSVHETNDDASNINSLPNEIILKVFNYLTQNQLGQIARVCRRWNVLTKSPVLWRKVNVKIFSSDAEKNAVAKSFINGLPSCVTFIRLDFSKFNGDCSKFNGLTYVDFEELCVKLHQNCPHVEELILTNLRISNLLPEVINYCTQFLQCLKKLVFHKCSFYNKSATVELNDNSKIEVLDLYGCTIFHFLKKHFSKLLYLKELRLSFSCVNDTWFADDTAFLNQLHVLDLGWTFITASTFPVIQRHGHNLKELYLCNSYLGDHDLKFNTSVFPHLRTICLSGTFVICEDIVSLIQSCPSLENVYVFERVAEYFAAHPFVVANRCKSGIVKAIDFSHNHNVDYSHN